MPVTIVSCRYHASVFVRGLTSAKELRANGRLNGQMNKCYGGYREGGGQTCWAHIVGARTYSQSTERCSQLNAAAILWVSDMGSVVFSG